MTDDPASRILTLDAVAALRQEAAKTGRRMVLTNGVFDLLHRGHLEYLDRSSKLGDLLVVAVNSDASVRQLKGQDRPLNNENDRAFALASLRCVAATFVFLGPRLAWEIERIRPDIYTKAGDYTLETLEASERAALQAAGVDIRFLPFVAGRSTTSLIQKMRLPEQPLA